MCVFHLSTINEQIHANNLLAASWDEYSQQMLINCHDIKCVWMWQFAGPPTLLLLSSFMGYAHIMITKVMIS